MNASASGITRQRTGIVIVTGARMATLLSTRSIIVTCLGQVQLLTACSHPLWQHILP